tara:strand:+ start:358 stop:753 length:396 start_codon:yes stop_codon:yes gene_type:complete
MEKEINNNYKSRLTAEQYSVTQEKATEAPFSGLYWNEKDTGTYDCICCDEPLFDSTTKYNSGTGWPSFWQPIDDDSIKTESDKSLGMERVEVLCNKCGAHLGHLFLDGPEPTGMRYCINSASLSLAKNSGA